MVAITAATLSCSSVYGAFHEYAGAKDISLWEYNGHEGGGIVDYELALSFFASAFAAQAVAAPVAAGALA